MTPASAKNLVRNIGRGDLVAKLVKAPRQVRHAVRVDGKLTWKLVDDYRVVFSGGESGTHSLDLAVSSKERILAHWDGYCSANGIRPRPRVDESVSFLSGSASKQMCGARNGRVVAVTPTRVKIKFWYKSGHVRTEESRSFVTLPIWKVSF